MGDRAEDVLSFVDSYYVKKILWFCLAHKKRERISSKPNPFGIWAMPLLALKLIRFITKVTEPVVFNVLERIPLQ